MAQIQEQLQLSQLLPQTAPPTAHRHQMARQQQELMQQLQLVQRQYLLMAQQPGESFFYNLSDFS